MTDEQWSRIEPHLPGDVRGKERVDDRRVISGIVHVLKSGCRWRVARLSTGLKRRSMTVLCVGRSAGSGKSCSLRLPGKGDRRTCK
ncbi:MAG TPA: transposase [Methylocella sp.]|nr:transposase [Methylocella sp.]